MKVLHDIEDMLCRELEEIVRKNDLTSNNLDVMYKALDILKDSKTIEAMEEGYSNNYSNEYSGMYRRPMYAYDNEGSYRGRERDSQGRYSSDYSRGYSRDSAEEIKKIMDNARDDKDKEILRRAFEELRR